jgi:hypothetical protein
MSMISTAASPTDVNQRELMAAVAEVRATLEAYGRRNDALHAEVKPQLGNASPARLDTLCSTFGLSGFERSILLLAAGVELDAQFAAVCATANGDQARAFPTFSLALAALPEPHWSAITPARPLRYWHLIERAAQPATPLLTAPLRIDERVLHYLTGIRYIDERLSGVLQELVEDEDIVPSHNALVREVADAWTNPEGRLPAIELCGADETTRRSIAVAGCAALSLRLYALSADQIPSNPAELESFLRLCERESALSSAAIYIEAESLDHSEARSSGQVSRFLERVTSAVLLGTKDRWRSLRRPLVSLDVRKPSTTEQASIWHAVLGNTPAAENGCIDVLVSQFNLSSAAIRASARMALVGNVEDPTLEARLWSSCVSRSRVRLDDLAHRIEPMATWQDLVLPPAEMSQLREIAAQVTRREQVYEKWGFAAKSRRGLGISAMFAGPSGTGKTTAAEVLANALRLDLYRIDLSSVVSKYIGETEKNLRRVFDAAEDGGAILFFDEADALFGKRSEVKDSHDRYANIEISYLLQRMEDYRGLAVLATNAKGSVDTAFLRRIRFVVNFPFPNAAERAEIWRRAFPAATPKAGLDPSRLARMNIAGGNIRNIALNAAFLAAEASEPVGMSHIARAARSEYGKMEKPLTDAEIGDLR